MAKKIQDPRRAEQRRAYRLRVKIRDGGTLDEDERAFLTTYEASLKKPGTADLPEPEPEPGEPGEPAPAPEVESAPAAAPPPPAAAPEPAPPMPDLPPGSAPPPPRVAASAPDAGKGGKSSGRWQDKYQAAGTGRETTVTTIADAWAGVLTAMADQLRAVGVEPFLDPKHLYGAIVLTVDDLLPAHVEVKPVHLAVLGSTAITAQRFMRRKEIAAHVEATKERAAHANVRAAAAAARAEPPPPPPAPAPEPAPAPASAPAPAPPPRPAAPEPTPIGARLRIAGSDSIDLSAPGTVI